MVTLQDCLDHVSLSGEHIELLSQHQDISESSAALFACSLMQQPGGAQQISQKMQEVIAHIKKAGQSHKLFKAMRIHEQFMQEHLATEPRI